MVDVIIIGCGPVGALAANLLGRAGLSVVVLEKETELHPLPRWIVVGAGTGGGLAAAVTMAASGVEAGAATPGLVRPAARS
mgnify:CR=1 FL=1